MQVHKLADLSEMKFLKARASKDEEFTQMEVEHFFLPGDEPILPSELKTLKLLFYLPIKESQTTVGKALESNIVNSSLVATHLARAQTS